MTATIGRALEERWPEIDELWLREVRPLVHASISDEDLIKRVAMPLSMKLLSMGIQAGIRGITENATVFEKPFEFVVAPSGAVSIRFLE
jgi:hypothetical protein